MMQSAEIRQHFFEFFKSKGHTIVPSAPIVIKDDPTLLFTNAGMNQFKDYFLGNKKPTHTRVADTQKCLRVSGKHNDLEEVGVDTYHHTMFEMLGNWSFGNSTENPAPYFKEAAIAWAWELLTEIYKIDKQRLYVTVFEGDEKEGLPKDEEAISFWKKWIDEERIIMGKKKDNFWEMGDSGPCGPCTEIHIDSRTDDERNLPVGKAGNIDGKSLVNKDHPQVIEIWNIVFIQYNRKKDGSLEPLPAKHVDTGMGFERLVRVLQNKQSNYDTDIFTGTIAEVEKLSSKKYTNTDSKQDVAFRVIADHIRAIAFPIADGQLPSNTGAGYVIRRILRRAVRYYFSYLDVKEPLLFKLIPLIAKQFKDVFPELEKQKDFVEKVVKEEEEAFLRTVSKGIDLITAIIQVAKNGFSSYTSEDPLVRLNKSIPPILAEYIQSSDNQKSLFVSNSKYSLEAISGEICFVLYDRYGFPFDLTKLIAGENNLAVDEEGFEKEMLKQKARSRAASIVDTVDWITILENGSSKFVGYDTYETESKVLKYRKTKSQGKESFQIVLDSTPFYAESGGQVGDTGVLLFGDEKIPVVNTKKENDLIIHFTNKLPEKIEAKVIAKIDIDKRKKIAVHHSATHLMHAALRKVLGNHVAQKGSLVNDEYLRFDFSHFASVTLAEIKAVEKMVNDKIRENIPIVIKQMSKEEALKTGAMALFGEKYSDIVRVVIIDPKYSIELCGGTHVGSTGELGLFIVNRETAVGAGIRRIEAKAGDDAFEYLHSEFITPMERIKLLTKKRSNETPTAFQDLISENINLKKQLEKFETKQLSSLKEYLLQKVETINGINFIGQIVDVPNADSLKKICFSLKNEIKNYVVVLAAAIDGKPYVAVMLDESIVSTKNIEAPLIIKEHIAPLIKGGGGGQKTLATAGGQDASKLNEVIEKIKSLL